jgi:hypothetical protein
MKLTTQVMISDNLIKKQIKKLWNSISNRSNIKCWNWEKKYIKLWYLHRNKIRKNIYYKTQFPNNLILNDEIKKKLNKKEAWVAEWLYWKGNIQLRKNKKMNWVNPWSK